MLAYFCECGQPLRDMWTAVSGALMVECPTHGPHEWGEVNELPPRRFGRVP